jgi:hypothetical protein
VSDHFDPSKAMAYAELEISGKNLDYENISRILNMEINYFRKKSDYSEQGSGVSVYHPHANRIHRWEYITEEKATYCISERLDDLLLVFKEKTSDIKKKKKMYDECEIKVCIILYNHQKLLPGIVITQEQIAFLAEIGASLDSDIYHSPES